MRSQIDTEISKLKKNFPKLGSNKDSDLFSLVCFSHIQKNGEFSQDIFDEYFCDAKGDGGIDMMYPDTDDDNFIFYQSKMISNLSNKQDIIDMVSKMKTTTELLKKNKAKVSQEFHTKFANLKDMMPYSSYNEKFVIFINASISDKMKKNISEIIDNDSSLKNLEFALYDKDEIENIIRKNKEEPTCVAEDKISIYKNHNQLEHHNTDGIIVSIKASSLQNLYRKSKDKGLFEQNFRYYIKNVKIDGQLKNSIQKNKDKFWYYNNGIIIGCEDFRIDGDNIKLYKFSIINGCQTTTLIGQFFEGNDDFPISCKIIKSENKDFIREIAEASNSQKPINSRDLKSNLPEQKQLQKIMKEEEPKIYVEIKRGEKLYTKSKGKNLTEWQKKTTNEYLGQLIMSCIMQMPGTARSNKKSIFDNTNFYDKIFKSKVDKNLYQDLLKLGVHIKNWSKEQQYQEEVRDNVRKYGKFSILSSLLFFIKYYRKVIFLEDRKKNSEKFNNDLKDFNLEGNLFKKNLGDGFEDTLMSLFGILTRHIASAYTNYPDKKTVTNFLKTDNNYREIIIELLIDAIINDPENEKEFNNKIKKLFI